MRVLVPLGTRPEIVKLAPVVHALRGAGLDVRTVATGQHYDASLTSAFFDGLGLQPDETWSVSGDEGERAGAILSLAHRELAERMQGRLTVRSIPGATTFSLEIPG